MISTRPSRNIGGRKPLASAALRLCRTLLPVMMTLLFLVLLSSAAQGGTAISELKQELRKVQDLNEQLRMNLERARPEVAREQAKLAEDEVSLGAADVDIAMLRQTRVDVDLLHSRLATLEGRIASRGEQLQSMEQQLERLETESDGEQATSIESVLTQVETRVAIELRDALKELMATFETLRGLGEARLRVAEDRLALLQSRLELEALGDQRRRISDPRIDLLQDIVATLVRDSAMMSNEAAALAAGPPGQASRKQLLALEADATFVRSDLRQTDLEMLQNTNRLQALETLAEDRAIPVRVLRDARAKVRGIEEETHKHRALLRDRLRALKNQAEILRQQQFARAAVATTGPLDLLGDLDQILQFQDQDLVALLQTASAISARFEERIDESYGQGLLHRSSLPGDEAAWQRLSQNLRMIPDLLGVEVILASEHMSHAFGQLSQNERALLVGSLLVITLGAFVLRGMLRTLVRRQPNSATAVPVRAVKLNLLWFLPALLWAVVAETLRVPRSAGLLTLVLLLIWPLIRLTLTLAQGYLLDQASAEVQVRRRSFYRTLRNVLVLAGLLGTILVLARGVSLSPPLQGLVDRLTMLGVLILVIPSLQFRPLILSAYRQFAGKTALRYRVAGWVSMLVPLSLLACSVVGLIGYTNMAWAILIHLAWLLVIGLIWLIAVSLLADAARWAEKRVRIRSLEHGYFWATNFVQPVFRLSLLAITYLAARLLFRIYDWDATTPGISQIMAAGSIPLFSLGEDPMTVQEVCVAVVLIILAFWVGGWSKQVGYHVAYRRIRDIGIRQSLSTFTQYVVIVLGMLLTFKIIGLDLTALTVFAASLGVGIGFGMQTVVNNFISGILLLVERPLRIGDVVSVKTYTGEVTRIGIRSLTVRTYDQHEVIIPNSAVISQEFTNWTHGNPYSRDIIMLSLSHQEDPARVMAIIDECLQSNEYVVQNPAPSVFLLDVTEFAIKLRVQYFVNMRGTKGKMAVRSLLMESIWARFAEEGVQLPGLGRDGYLKELGMQALQAPAAG